MEPQKLQQQYKELEILNTIAVQLNSTAELNEALRITLQHTCQLLNMNTGWIWLLHPATNAVFLAASHNLPPVLRKHPERLSGECYCITRYLEDDLEAATNISEITCTRLKDIEEGTDGLKFHATIPLFDQDQKIGLLNLVSATSVKFTTRQLDMLHTIGTLLSTAVIRTRRFENSKQLGAIEERKRLADSVYNKLFTKVEQLKSTIDYLAVAKSDNGHQSTLQELQQLTTQLLDLTRQTSADLHAMPQSPTDRPPLQYPTTPLTNRELEVLQLLKQGKTNKAIAAELFVTERTIKFHVSTLLSKLDAGNRTEAVQVAIQRGIVRY
ncbi:MAG: LuxR C-terminal-related transcriptional regulator [Bacteroidota bacterium]